jgi:hypothetical protein
MDVAGPVELGDHELCARLTDGRDAGKRDPCFWCTPDGQLTITCSLR